MRKILILALSVFLINSNAFAGGINPYALNGLLDGFARGMEMGERAREAQFQRYLIEREIAALDNEMQAIREAEIRIKKEEKQRRDQLLLETLINNQMNKIKKASYFVGGDLELSKKINTPLKEILNWKNGHKIPDAWSCKRIEQATNGQVKAQHILPFFNFSELR